MMASEKSPESLPHASQLPIGTAATTSTVDEKRILLETTQAEDPAPPPAYSEAVEEPISEVPSPPNPSSRPSNLRKPIAIPATAAAFDSPFLRAYPPILMDYNLPREPFLSFLDKLNRVIASSPPLQVLDAAGGILGQLPILFPLHWVGAAISGVAHLGNVGVSKSRTDLFLRQANKDIFSPRGLKVEIAKLNGLVQIAGIPILDSQGSLNWDAVVNQPSTVEGTHQTTSLNAQQRRLGALQPWIADLEIDTLPAPQQSQLTRFNAALKKRQQHGRSPAEGPSLRAQRQRQRQADEQQQRRALALEDHARALRVLDYEEAHARAHNGPGREQERALADIARRRAEARRRYDDEDGGRVVGEGAVEEQEPEGFVKALWLVVREVTEGGVGGS